MRDNEEEQLLQQIKDWISEYARELGIGPIVVSDETDLLRDGVVDSLAFVDLLLFVQSVTGREIDLADADPDDFTKVAGLCRLALAETEDRAG